MPELSMEHLMKMFNWASLGKVIGGLIHNLNGPLQNLGLDMELAGYALKKEPAAAEKDILIDIGLRLKRMEEEFDQIDQLIKASSIKAGNGEDLIPEISNLNQHIEQELWFLKTNLYFKHNVNTELELQDDRALTYKISKNIMTALDWFLLELVEELEKGEIKGLKLKTYFNNEYLVIHINTTGKLSKDFLKSLDQAGSFTDRGLDSGIFLVMIVFLAEGVYLNGKDAGSGSQIEITIPI